jgi:hypothetical protein
LRRVVSPRQLPITTGKSARRQDKKTPIPPTRESVASTSTSCSPTFLFGAGNGNHNSHKFTVSMGSSASPAVILPWPLPASMPMQSVSPQYLLRCHPHGLHPPLLAPRATENDRIQLPYARIPVAPAQFNQRAPSTIAHAPRQGGPAEIAAQAMGDVPTWLILWLQREYGLHVKVKYTLYDDYLVARNQRQDIYPK